MPELPEVETIRRDLVERIVGRRLLGYGLVSGIKRIGKILAFEFQSGKYLLIHLKMTGQLIYLSSASQKEKEVIPGGHEGPPINRYTRRVFRFADGAKILFNDLRRFGYVKLVKTLPELGPDPLERRFSLKEVIENRRANIKSILLNQKLISGIGNIYADEILLAAGIRPERRVNTLKREETKRIEKFAKSILEKAVKYRGTTFSDYLDAKGQKGGFQKRLKIYGREGEPCKKCKQEIIKKIRLNGRGTRYCPNCQV